MAYCSPVATPKKLPPSKKSPVYDLKVFQDRLEFKNRGKRLVTRDPRLIHKTLAILAEIYLT